MQLFPFWHAGMGKGRETEKKIEVKKEGGERMRGGERGGCWRTRLVNHEEVETSLTFSATVSSILNKHGIRPLNNLYYDAILK